MRTASVSVGCDAMVPDLLNIRNNITEVLLEGCVVHIVLPLQTRCEFNAGRKQVVSYGED